jgi:hypothetical protein
MDEVAPAPVDERAVVARARERVQMFTEPVTSLTQAVRLKVGIIVHQFTSIYIKKNEVEPRLGTNVEVHSSYILLTYSQNTLTSTCSHPDASCGRKEPS